MPTADEDALRAMRAASPALQEWWPDGWSPRSWKGVTWSDDRVQELNFEYSKLEVLAPEIGQLQALTQLNLYRCPLKALPHQIGQLRALTTLGINNCPLKELPLEIGQLLALTDLSLRGCEQLTLAPGAEKGQPAQTTVAAYAPLLIVEPRKDTPGQLHAFLLANPLAVPAFFKHIITDAAYAVWLGEAVKATPELAELTDADGRRAIDRAHETCRVRMQTPGQLHAFLLANPLAVPAFCKTILTDVTGTVIAAWFAEAVEATPELAHLTAPDGRRAIDVAEEAQLSRATAKPDEDALRAMRAASPALQKFWPDGKEYRTYADKGLIHDGESPRSWKCVTWSKDRVQELDLKGSKLEALPPEIGQLQALTKLVLRGCKLVELPPEIGQLRVLTSLDLDKCPLLAALPAGIIGQLQALTYCSLNGWSQLAAPLPDELALRAMRAASSALQIRWPEGESPRSWKGVTWSDDRVQQLNFEDSKLKALAPEIGQLQALTELSLQACRQLKELPAELGQLQALTKLVLRGCLLKELPPELGQLRVLTSLDLENCPLLPWAGAAGIIGQLQALTYCSLNGWSQLAAPLPDELVLWAMRAASSALQKRWPEGESPRSWKGVTWSDDRVHELDFENSKLKALAPEIGQLQALTELSLQACRQLKELPAELGQLLALTNLRLNNCPLKALPPEVGQLLALTELGLEDCEQLTLALGAKAEQPAQTIVAAYARLLIVEPHKETPDQLHTFMLANSLWVPAFFKYIVGNLTGDVFLADWLREATKATPELAHLTDPDGRRTIDVAKEARLSCATAKPDEDALRAMRAVSPALQDQKINSEEWWSDSEHPRSWIGVEWSDDRVQGLDLEGSELEVLPPQIGQLQALTWLDLTKCPLEVLPPQIGQLQALTKLGLSGCKLVELPPEIGQLRALTTLRLDGCPLKELPPEIGQLRALIELVLELCPLKELPPEIGQLLDLTDLDLDGCPLKELPLEIGQLLDLTDLRLDDCEQLTLAPGAEEGQSAQTMVAAYATLLIVEPHKNTPDQLHAFLLEKPFAVPAFFKFILIDATHTNWLGEAANATPELAELTDALGRRAADAAHATCRRRMLESSWLCKRYELQAGPPEHLSATSVVIRADDHADKPDYAKIFKDADKDKSGTLEGKELDVVAEKLGLSRDLVGSEANKQGSATSKDGTTQLDKDQFVSACKKLLGDGPRKVVIKLMKDKVQWQREMESRSWELDPNTKEYVLNEATLDAQYVVQALDATSQVEMAAAMSESRLLEKLAETYLEKASSTEKASIKDCLGPHTIIMDAADRNLHQIYLQERPDINAVRTILKQVFKAVAHLHEKKLMHGDLKMLNVVRFRRDNRLRLIDLDAAAKIVVDGGEGESFAGAKFSSATLPPEMFFELTTEAQREQLEEYWKDEGEELRAKVAPKSYTKTGIVKSSYAVKSFRMTGDERGDEPVFEGLPYVPVEASEKVDVWALGALAFSLLTGETLIPATRDDDCASGAAMRVVYDWDSKARGVLERLEKISDDAAHDLVGNMLQRDPSERPTVKKLLEHPFFHPKSVDSEIVKKMEEHRKETQANFDKLGNKLTQIDSKIDQVLHQLSVQFTVLSTVLSGVAPKFLAPRLICFLPADGIDNTSNQSFSTKIKSFKPRNLFNQTVRVFFFDPIRLTLAPTNDGEGFELTYPKEWVAKAMPYVKLGLVTLKVAYVAGRLAGFPVPDVAGVVGDWIDGQLGELSSLAGEATAWLSAQTNDPAFASSLLEQVDENARKAISGEIDTIKPLEGDALGNKMRAPLEKSFEELDTLLKVHGDWRTKSGLVLTTNKVDGTSEYVLEADRAA